MMAMPPLAQKEPHPAAIGCIALIRSVPKGDRVATAIDVLTGVLSLAMEDTPQNWERLRIVHNAVSQVAAKFLNIATTNGAVILSADAHETN